MGKMLVIAEKASAGMDFANVLGATEKHDGYMEGQNIIVTWAQGHLVGLKDPEDHNEKFKTWRLEDLPLIFPIENNLKVINPKIFNKIKALIHRPDVEILINGGDIGVEGQVIQDWIYKMAGNKKPVKRLWCDTLTDNSIKKAFENLQDNSFYQNLFEAGEARAELDQFYGYNYSRALTLTKSEGLTLTYGRCQTTLLNKIIERDFEVENFKSTPYWVVKSQFSFGELSFDGVLVGEDGKSAKLENEIDAVTIANQITGTGIISDYNKEIKKKKAPLLYNLNELQCYMAKKFKYDPDETLGLAQSLYDTHKIMSYPRTDSRYLSTDLEPVIINHLNCLNFGKYSKFVQRILHDQYSAKIPPKYFNDKKIVDHHAIIPAINENMEAIYNKLSIKEKTVFDAIIESLIALYFPDYEYESVSIITKVKDFSFSTTGTHVLSLGWKSIISDSENEDVLENDSSNLPDLSNVKEVKVNSCNYNKEMTKPKKHFTADTLLKLMEMYHIGTAATQADIIKKLRIPKGKNKIAYVEKKGEYFISTSFARDYIKFIPENLRDVSFVSKIELKLKEIQDGKLKKDVLMQELISELKSNLNNLITSSSEKLVSKNTFSDSRFSCPLCNKPLISYSWGYGCSGYKDENCSFSISSSFRGKKLSDSQLKQLLTSKKTSVIKGFKKNNSNDTYEGILTLDDKGKIIFSFPPKTSSSNSTNKIGSGSKTFVNLKNSSFKNSFIK